MRAAIIPIIVVLAGSGVVLATESRGQEALKKKISVEVRNQEMLVLLNKIEEVANIRFIYSPEVIPVHYKVSLEANNDPLGKVLKKLLDPYGILFEAVKDQIVLRKQEASTGHVDRIITGQITDENNGPLPGVSIIIKGSTIGTTSDATGKYSLDVPTDHENGILVFSFIGYVRQEIAIAGRTVIDVELSEDVTNLEEVVVVGYGTQRKATLTGSVATVNTESVESSPTINLINALYGLLPGLTVTNNSGSPGALDNEILIRGKTTTGDNSPLVVVDGVQNPPGWQRIPSKDIESISVLKDAAAAIYGAQAANGVILITTKRGKIGKPVINFTFNQGLSTPTRLPELANSALFAEYVNEIRIQDGQQPPYTPQEIELFRNGTDPNYPNVDWYDEVLKDYALQSRHNISIRGGNESILYSASGSYSNENSIFEGGIHEFNGFTLRSNLDANVTENIGLNVAVNLGFDDRVQPGAGRNPFSALNQLPMIPVYYPGGLPSGGIEQGNNPAVMVTDASGNINTQSNRSIINIGFDSKIPQVEGLSIDGYFVYSNEDVFDKIWRTPWTIYDYNQTEDEYIARLGGGLTAPELTQTSFKEKSTFLNARILYENQFGDHNLNAFIGAEQKEGTTIFYSAFRRDFISKALPELFAGDPGTQQNDGYSRKSSRRSLLGRASYNYKEKYMVDINARYDGSYIFAKGNRYGFFPGVSVAWMINEDFFKGLSSMNELKLRASIGQMGNDKIEPYQFLTAYSVNNEGYHLGLPTTTQLGIVPGVTPNPDVTWEVATIQNIGVDATFWNGGLGITVDVFKQRRENILTTRNLEIPVHTGLSLPFENIGIVENKGIELSLLHRKRAASSSSFAYSLSGNIAYARNKVIELSEANDVPSYQKAEGRILGAGLYYDAIGIFRVQEDVDEGAVFPGTQVGDLQYRDVDGNGSINAADRLRMDKSSIPEVSFGFNASMSYGNFSLFAHFAGQSSAWQYYYQTARASINGLEELIANRYTPGSMDSKYPRLPSLPVQGAQPSSLVSDFWLQNAAFVRLKTLELSYDFSEAFLSRMNISSLRLYLNGNNIFTSSDIKWFDPEGRGPGSGFYPQNKIFNIGIDLSL